MAMSLLADTLCWPSLPLRFRSPLPRSTRLSKSAPWSHAPSSCALRLGCLAWLGNLGRCDLLSSLRDPRSGATGRTRHGFATIVRRHAGGCPRHLHNGGVRNPARWHEAGSPDQRLIGNPRRSCSSRQPVTRKSRNEASCFFMRSTTVPVADRALADYWAENNSISSP